MNNLRLISTKSVQSPNREQNRNHHFNISFQKIMKFSTKVEKKKGKSKQLILATLTKHKS
jgi:hypothetical protein